MARRVTDIGSVTSVEEEQKKGIVLMGTTQGRKP